MKKVALVCVAVVLAGCLLASAWGQLPGQKPVVNKSGRPTPVQREKADADATSPFKGGCIATTSKGDERQLLLK
jgi:hypothetical protein